MKIVLAVLVLSLPFAASAIEPGDRCHAQTSLPAAWVCEKGKVSEGVENGQKCKAGDPLPAGVLCHDGETLDCRNIGSLWRTAAILCGGERVSVTRRDMTALYNQLLADLKDRKPDSGKSNPPRNFIAVRVALIKSQKAWEASSGLDCRIRESLFVGNAATEDMQACEEQRILERTRWLKTMQESVDYVPSP